MPAISQRLTGLAQSDIRAMTRLCEEMGGINLGQGVCDTPPPQPLIEALMPAVEAGFNTYSRFDGTAELRKALAVKTELDSGRVLNPDLNFVVTHGTTGGFASIVNALLNPGDRILLFEPYYGYHLNTSMVAGLEPVFVPTQADDFSLDAERLEQAAQGAKAIVLNTPCNPSGHVFSRAELETIADICQRYDLLCISDEIYEYFIYDDHRHLRIAEFPGMDDRTLTLSGFSKTFSITGWRIGYVCGPPELLEPVGLVNDLYYACAATPLQQAVATAVLQLDRSFYTGLAQDHQNKRDRFCKALTDAGLKPVIPQGAYYVLADIRKLGFDTSKEAAMYLLKQTRVTGIPGSAFFSGAEGERWIRFCFGKDDDVLDRACEQLRKLA